MPFKIDQNKDQNRSIDKVQNLGIERRYIYNDPRQDSGQRNISYTRYLKKCFTQTYRDWYGNAMLDQRLDELQHGARKPTETSVSEFCYKQERIQDFFLGGVALVSCSTNTNKPHSFIYFIIIIIIFAVYQLY